MSASIVIGPSNDNIPRVLVTITTDSDEVFRVVQTSRSSGGDGDYVVEKREDELNATGGEEWQQVTGEGFSLLGPLAREFHASFWP
jgi:hypothetical protein